MRIDPEIEAAIEDGGFSPFVTERDDWKALRDAGNAAFEKFLSVAPQFQDVATRDITTVSADGAIIAMRWYVKKADGAVGPAFVFAHGGGLVMGNIDFYTPFVSSYVSATGVPFLSVGYRPAPQGREEMLAEDVFAGLQWLVKNAKSLGVDVNRIGVMGDSAGGGIAAGAAILARDRQVSLATQVLIYPMLDHRNVVSEPRIAQIATWTYENNYTGWGALLGSGHEVRDVSPVASPARLQNHEHLAPAYIDVGTLDIFCDEDIVYARRLASAGVSVELHVHPDVPHAFDLLAPDARITQRAMADRLRVVRGL